MEALLTVLILKPESATALHSNSSISRLMALASQFDELIRTRYCLNITELTRVAMVIQPRINQSMNLLHLTPDIQEEILFLPKVPAGCDPIHEKQLRRVCAELFSPAPAVGNAEVEPNGVSTD